jgi:DNA-binding protein H-NS
MSTNLAALREHLAAIEAQKAEIEAQVEAQKESAKAELLEQFKEQIQACGFDAEEIALAIAPKLTRAVKKTAKKATTLRKAGITKVYYNPANPDETYSKGPAPAWLKQMMTDAGIDITDKAAVKAFKEANLGVHGAEHIVDATKQPAAEAAEPPVTDAPGIGLPPAMPPTQEALAA